jgi:CRP-like cAMP-binding protein
MTNPKLTPINQSVTDCARCPVRRIALFKQVPEDKLHWTQEYRKGQYLLRAREHLYYENEEHPVVYTLFDGCIKLYKTLHTGKMQAMRFALPGDFLGFQGDLCNAMHHGAQALTDCVLCAFPKAAVSRMLCECPEIATELIDKNARVMATCQEQLLSTGARNAIESIAFTLVELNHRLKQFRVLRTESPALAGSGIPMTQEDLADAVGLTPIHVNRTLRQLREMGMVFCAKGRIDVIDEEGLKDMARFNPKHIEDAYML